MYDLKLLSQMIYGEKWEQRSRAMEGLTLKVRVGTASRTVTQIKGRLQRLDLPNTSQEDREKVVRDYFSSLSPEDVGQVFLEMLQRVK